VVGWEDVVEGWMDWEGSVSPVEECGKEEKEDGMGVHFGVG